MLTIYLSAIGFGNKQSPNAAQHCFNELPLCSFLGNLLLIANQITQRSNVKTIEQMRNLPNGELNRIYYLDMNFFVLCRTFPEIFVLCRTFPEIFVLCRTFPEIFVLCHTFPESFVLCNGGLQNFCSNPKIYLWNRAGQNSVLVKNFTP
jgi:hypothetical protein